MKIIHKNLSLTSLIFHLLFLMFLVANPSQSNASFEEFIDKNNQIILVIEPHSGRIIKANQTAADFYGYEIEQLTSMSIQDINQLSTDQVAAERQLAKKEQRNYFIFRHKTADGSVKTVEVSSYPLQIMNDIHLVSVIDDITAEREIQDSLWHYQNRLEDLVDQQTSILKTQNHVILAVVGFGLLITSFLGVSLFKSLKNQKKINDELSRERKALKEIIWGTGAGTWSWSVQTGEVEFNTTWASMIGYTLEELEPLNVKTWEKLLHKDDLAKAMNALDKCFNKIIDDYSIDFRMQHKDGHWVWISAKGKVVEWDIQGNPVRMAGTHQDISSNKQLEKHLIVARKEAVAANSAKSDFLANMSHELRTPMMGIRGTLDLMKDNKLLMAHAGEYLSDIDMSSQSLLTLLDDILDLSKIEAGKLTLNYSIAEPARIIENIQNIFESRLTNDQVKMRSNVYEFREYFCRIEDLRFRQIVTNLVSNAVKFTHKGSIEIDLKIRKSSPKDILSVEVKDTGIGMTEKEINKIFMRFEQAESGTSRRYGGTGLGLTICRELSALMGGEVSVTSQKGIGSQFKLTLPVERAEEIYIEEKETDLSGLKILLAEDNPINQKVLSAMLTKKQHHLSIVSNGLEAVQEAEKDKYDIILMDMNMPEMDGMEATRLIRNNDNLNLKTPIIALTADAITEHRENFIKSGVDEVVTKPLHIEKLQEKMSEILKLS